MTYEGIPQEDSNRPTAAGKVMKGLVYSLLLMAHADKNEGASQLVDAILSHEDILTRALDQSLNTLEKADLIALLRSNLLLQLEEYRKQGLLML